MQQEIKQFVVSLLEKKQRLPKGIDVGSYRYIESGHIDSLAIVNFVVALEDKFDVEILDDDMISDSFQTVDGVVNIICGKL